MKASRKTVRKGGASVKVSATLGIGHAKADIHIVEIENPHFSRTHTGSPGNPKKVPAAMNVRESAITLMYSKRLIEAHHVEAANKFRRYWEMLGGAGAGSFDYSREIVDGGGVTDPITERQIKAGLSLKLCQSVIGHKAYGIVERVCGEGRTIAEFSHSHREKTTNMDYLRDALDALSEHWGYQDKRRAV